MDRATIIAVDDDEQSLAIIERELNKRYGADYRVICRRSPAIALGDLRLCAARERAGRAHHGRPVDARDERRRVSRRGETDRPRRQARHAGDARRPRRAPGDPRRPRLRTDRVVHLQTTGGGTRRTVPPPRLGVPLRVVARASADLRGGDDRRPAMVGARLRAARHPAPQRSADRFLLRGGRRRPLGALSGTVSTPRRACRSSSSSAGRCSATRRTARWPRPWA